MLTNLNLFPPVFLAPMAGITDTPSREIAQLFNPGLVVSEMIASSEQDKKYFETTVRSNLSSAQASNKFCPTAIQIAGSESEWMCYAAKIISNEGGDLIDINMGCPAKRIVGKLAGSALMREPVKALKLIESIVSSSKIPVTLKMRLGWDEENINAPIIAKSAQDCGIQMITIHARTRNQFFKGDARWAMVKKIKENVSIPIIVNGDIVDVSTAEVALKKSCADGIMVGRGTIGKPWLLYEIANRIYEQKKKENFKNNMLGDLVRFHMKKMLNFYGDDAGINIFRKHLVGYLNHLNVNKDVKKSLLIEKSPNALENKIKSLFCRRKLMVEL